MTGPDTPVYAARIPAGDPSLREQAPAGSGADARLLRIAEASVAADLLPVVTTLRSTTQIVVDAALIDAFQIASSRQTLLALRSDLSAFDLRCRANQRITLPPSPQGLWQTI